MELDQFLDSLDEDLAWRKKEISELQLLCGTHQHQSLVKSLLLMLYAHWEGFIRNSSKLYLFHVSKLSIDLDDLTVNFNAISLKGIAKGCQASADTSNLKNELTFLEEFLSSRSDKFVLPGDFTRDKNKNIINTQDNVTPEVFSNICKIVGTHDRPCLFPRKQYFDKTFINSRNAVSHGSKVLLDGNNAFDLDLPELIKLKEIALLVMSHFQDDLKEYAIRKFYLKVNQDARLQYDMQSDLRLAIELETIN